MAHPIPCRLRPEPDRRRSHPRPAEYVRTVSPAYTPTRPRRLRCPGPRQWGARAASERCKAGRAPSHATPWRVVGARRWRWSATARTARRAGQPRLCIALGGRAPLAPRCAVGARGRQLFQKRVILAHLAPHLAEPKSPAIWGESPTALSEVFDAAAYGRSTPTPRAAGPPAASRGQPRQPAPPGTPQPAGAPVAALASWRALGPPGRAQRCEPFQTLPYAVHCIMQSEFEKARIAERVKAGLAQARRRGKRLGRPARRISGTVLQRTAGLSVRGAAREIGV